MRAIATPRITGNGLRLAVRWRKASPLTYWPCMPMLACAALLTFGLALALWRMAWQGYRVCAWMGVDLEP